MRRIEAQCPLEVIARALELLLARGPRRTELPGLPRKHARPLNVWARTGRSVQLRQRPRRQ